MKNIVVIGLLGPTLDMGKQSKRWERWRPTVALCQHEDLLVSRFELLYQKRFKSLQDLVVKDIKHISPETEVVSYPVDFRDPWDLEEVYAALHDFAKAYAFDQDSEEYLVHITTGTHVAQICLYLLTESNYLPAKLIQTSPSSGKKKDNDVSGEYRIIDLDLSKYDRIAMRFRQEIDDDITFLKSGIETHNKAFNALIERIEQVAMNSTDPVLITGPTGAGKSNLARRIYELKRRDDSLKVILLKSIALRCVAMLQCQLCLDIKKARLQGQLRTERDFYGRQTKECFFWMKSANSALMSSQCCFALLKKKNFFP